MLEALVMRLKKDANNTDDKEQWPSCKNDEFHILDNNMELAINKID